MPVMVTVVRRPPQHALLRRRHGYERDDKLEYAAGLERAMRKIAMISGGDEEHAHHQEREAGHQVIPMKWNEKDQQRCYMNEKERK
jgi:hypothetical protein